MVIQLLQRLLASQKKSALPTQQQKSGSASLMLGPANGKALPQQDDPSYMQRLVALRLLRENMYYNDPAKYTLADSLHSIPGSAQSVIPAVENVLPSAAVISQDPEERKQQIAAALDRIRATKQSKGQLSKEILHNSVTMGLGSIPIGLAMGALFHGINPRWIRGNRLKSGLKLTPGEMKNALESQVAHLRDAKIPAIKGPDFEKSVDRVWQAPGTPLRNLRRLFTNKGFYAKYKNLLLRKSMNDALWGAGMGAAAGAIYPILSHHVDVTPKALEDARKIMQEQPYITGMPTSEMLSVIRQKKDEQASGFGNKLKNIGLGVGLGAATMGLGAATPSLFRAAGGGLRNVSNAFEGKALNKVFTDKLKHNLNRDVRLGAAFGGGIGALSGAFTNNIISDETQHLDSHQT